MAERVAAPEPLCSVQTVAPLLGVLPRLGVDEAEVLARAGLTKQQVRDAELRIPHAQSVEAWQAAYDLAQDPAMGLHVVEHLDTSYFSLFTYLTASSATPREAYERSTRYVRIVHDVVSVVLRVEGKRTICETSFFGPDRERWAAEYGVGLMVKFARLVVGEEAKYTAWFAHPEPDYVDEYHRVLGVRIRFDAPCDAVVGPTAELDTPLPRADSELCALIERHAAELLARVPEVNGFDDLVRQRIAAALPNGNASADGIADGLRMSARTLRRRLSELGTSHQKLLDEVRCELAERALTQRGVSVNEVAFLLGFSDASAFNKAYRRWTGRSPGEALNRRRAGA